MNGTAPGLVQRLQDSLSLGRFVKLLLAGPRGAEVDLERVIVRRIVLRDEPCTTHWEDLADLRAQFPALQVQAGVRWVEAQQGRLVTSAGISAGIDMSLHLVARMAASVGWDGTALAEATARQMDYPWVRT